MFGCDVLGVCREQARVPVGAGLVDIRLSASHALTRADSAGPNRVLPRCMGVAAFIRLAVQGPAEGLHWLMRVGGGRVRCADWLAFTD